MKLKDLVLTAVIVPLCFAAAGCSTAGMFVSGNLTDVQLQSGNYTIVARGVTGEAKAAYLFGVSVPMGMTTNTFAVARVDGTGMLYKEAMDNMWKNFESAHGPAEGKRLALINVHYDTDALNLVIYTQPKVTVRADVVEFTE